MIISIPTLICVTERTIYTKNSSIEVSLREPRSKTVQCLCCYSFFDIFVSMYRLNDPKSSVISWFCWTWAVCIPLMAWLKESPSLESFFMISLKPSSSESLSAALVHFRRFLCSLLHVISAFDSNFVELGVAGEGVERPSDVCSASSTGSGVAIPTCLSLL